MYLPYQSFKQVILKWIYTSSFKLNEDHFTFHLQYKHSGMFANRKYEDWTFVPPKSKNVQPHYSQSSRENATPSSGTSPLASYKEVTPWAFWSLRITLCPCNALL